MPLPRRIRPRAYAALALAAALVACRHDSTAPKLTHPAGRLGTPTPLEGGPFGVAISRAGVAYVGRHFVDLLTRFNLPDSLPAAHLGTGRDVVDVAFDPGGTIAYYTNQFTSSVGVVNVGTDATVATIPVSGNAWRVKVSSDGARVYATTNTGNLVVIDAASRSVLRTVSLGAELNGIAGHPSDTLVYLTSFTTGRMFEVNTRTFVSRVANASGAPQDIALSRDGTEMYIANESGFLDVRSVVTGERIAQVTLAGGGFGLAVSPDEAQLYVTIPGSGKVQVIDRASRAPLFTIATSGTPRRVAFDRRGALAIVANESGWVDFIR